MRSARPSSKAKLKNLGSAAATKSRSAGFFDPEFAPPGRADRAVDQSAGARRLEQRASAALLIALWRSLITDRRLRHFCRGFSHRSMSLLGSTAPNCQRPSYVSFAPGSGRNDDTRRRQKRAMNDVLHCKRTVSLFAADPSTSWNTAGLI